MDYLQTNPDLQHLKLALWLSVGAISLLTGIVIFFLNLFVRKITGSLTENTSATKDLSDTFVTFKVEFTKLKTKFETELPDLTKKVNTHSYILGQHEKRIGNIEILHNQLHKNCKLPNTKNDEVDY